MVFIARYGLEDTGITSAYVNGSAPQQQWQSYTHDIEQTWYYLSISCALYILPAVRKSCFAQTHATLTAQATHPTC